MGAESPEGFVGTCVVVDPGCGLGAQLDELAGMPVCGLFRGCSAHGMAGWVLGMNILKRTRKKLCGTKNGSGCHGLWRGEKDKEVEPKELF